MISTRILLLLAALAQACIAVGSTNQVQGKPIPEDGCPQVSEDSFRRLNLSTTKHPNHLALRLGQFCQDLFHKNMAVTCIGHLGPTSRNCPLCCACRGGGDIIYTNTTTPKNYPCGKLGKGKSPRTL
uniref:Putative ixostatin n=1 Tax=Ixodes ricinus TaxID=34613 RepID=A0A0K8RCX7_IXORI